MSSSSKNSIWPNALTFHELSRRKFLVNLASSRLSNRPNMCSSPAICFLTMKISNTLEMLRPYFELFGFLLIFLMSFSSSSSFGLVSNLPNKCNFSSILATATYLSRERCISSVKLSRFQSLPASKSLRKIASSSVSAFAKTREFLMILYEFFSHRIYFSLIGSIYVS